VAPIAEIERQGLTVDQSLGVGCCVAEGCTHIVEKFEELHPVVLHLPNPEIVPCGGHKIRVHTVLVRYKHNLGGWVRMCKVESRIGDKTPCLIVNCIKVERVKRCTSGVQISFK
jgi:hypothetical protein